MPEDSRGEITKIKFEDEYYPLWIKHTPARLATNILSANSKTKYTQIAVIGLPGTGKTTLTRLVIHHIHTKAPEFQLHFFYKDDITRLDEILESLPKKRDCVLFFDDISFVLDNLPKERVSEILHKLTTVREVLDPEHKKTRCIIFLDFHYSYALLKAFRQTNFRIITSVTDEEIENYKKILGYHNQGNIREYVRKYMSMMLYDKFEIESPGEKPFVYYTDKPFRISLVSNFGQLHFMLFHDIHCGICNPKGHYDRPQKDFWLDLIKTYDFSLVYSTFGEYVFTSTGKLTISERRKKVWNHIQDHHREFKLDLEEMYRIFKEVKKVPRDQRKKVFADMLAALEKKYPDNLQKTSAQIEGIPPEKFAGDESSIQLAGDDEDDDDDDDFGDFDMEGGFTLGGYDPGGGGLDGGDGGGGF